MEVAVGGRMVERRVPPDVTLIRIPSGETNKEAKQAQVKQRTP